MDTATSPLTLDQAFTEYRQVYLSARNLAHKTRVDYTIDVTQLLTFLQDRGITLVSQLDLSQLNAFLADMDTRELSGYTRRRKVSSIKSFCSFLESLGYVQKNPALRLIPPKRESTTPRVLTEGEYKRLQEAVGPKDLKTTSLYVGLAREQMNKEMQENALYHWHFILSDPKEHWKTIRTNHVIERLFGEVKRRSHKLAAAFRNEGSCLLLFSAVIRSLKFKKQTMPMAPSARI
jgi:hypothetical protein